MIDRITILGGSSVYVPEFILSLISHNVNIKELALYGRTQRKLELVSQFCQRLFDKSGFPAKVIPYTDPADAVRGAKYIINQVRVGGMLARARDEKLPLRFSMIGDESLGPGGFANALRTLPVVLRLAEITEAVNPTATFINLTNPLGIIVDALTKHSRLNVLGVCDLPVTLLRRIAHLLGHEPNELTFDYLGLNHIGWVQDVKHDGRSLMQRLLERLDGEGDEEMDVPLIQLFRMIPTRTVSLFYHMDQILKKQQTCARFRAEVLHEAEQQILKLYENPQLSDVPDLTRARNAVWYEETIVPLIKASEGKQPQEFMLCVRNDGAIRDLPDNGSVEIPVRVCRDGIVPRKLGSCPRFLKGLFTEIKESDRLTVEAVRHGSYEWALQALTIHPLVPSLDTARKYLDRVIKDEHLELH